MNNFLNDQLLARFKELGPQDVRDPVIVAKFFAPWSYWIWYAFAYDEVTGLFFGLIQGQQSELGYFAMTDLRGLRGPHGLRVERDLYWREKRLSDLIRRQPALSGLSPNL